MTRSMNMEDVSNGQEFYESNYEYVSAWVCLTSEQNFYLGNNQNRVCRYCGKSKTEVTFKKKAHAVPEFIGNKSLFANDECDQCNEFFSKTIENHLANYLHLYRTFAKIDGKKRSPKYNYNCLRIEADGQDSLIISDRNPINIDEITKTAKILGYLQPHIPVAAFKCFVKMAIAIASDNLLKELKHLKEWIRLEQHTYESLPVSPLVVSQQFTSGKCPHKGVSLFLIRRNNDNILAPYLQFIVAFANTSYQVILPMIDKDEYLINKPFELVPFPVPFFDYRKYEKTTLNLLRMHYYELVKNHPCFVEEHYDEITIT